MTQNQALLRLLRLRGPEGVTPLDALRELGCFRAAARVWELKAAGHDIRTDEALLPTGKKVARYVLVEEPQQLAWTAA